MNNKSEQINNIHNYIIKLVDDYNKKYNFFISKKETNDLLQKFINSNNLNLDDNLKHEIDLTVKKFVDNKLLDIKKLHDKFPTNSYKSKNIETFSIFTKDENISIEVLENLFFHFAPNKFNEQIDTNGFVSAIGENSEGIDKNKSIFFSKGIEGVLQLWDVWLRWRLDQMFNPKYKNNDFTMDEVMQIEYWEKYYITEKWQNNDLLLSKLFEYQYAEMLNSSYYVLDLKENEEFVYDQIDWKKQHAKKNNAKAIMVMMGNHTNWSIDICDKWNMQTIPGLEITIPPSKIKKVVVDEKDDLYSVVSGFYYMYKSNVPKEKQVTFDLLDNYIEYIDMSKNLNQKNMSSNKTR